MESEFVCVECGTSSSETYHKYHGGIIKISQCSKCRNAVDKYIEFDATIILLDALLHKHQAYRHLLCNTNLQWYWKLLIVLLFCDTYLQWQSIHSKQHLETDQDLSLLYAALESDFYPMFLYAVIDWVVFCTAVTCLVLIRECVLCQKRGINSYHRVYSCSHTIVRGLTVSSFGKLLIIPATIWGQSHMNLCLFLSQLFVFTSNASSLRVLFGLGRASSGIILILAHFVQYGSRYVFECQSAHEMQVFINKIGSFTV